MDGGIVALLTSVIVVAAALGVAWPVFRSKSNAATVELLEKSLAIERNERLASEDRCERRMREVEANHQREVGELNGRISALTPAFARTLALAIVEVNGERGDPGGALGLK